VGITSDEVYDRFYAGVPRRRDMGRHETFYANDKAKRLVGFAPPPHVAMMYFNTYEWDHVEWSETRFYMALVMGSTMAAIMLLFMLGMYKSKVVNAAILGTALVVFALTLWLVRSQTTVQDTSYMRAMIPHHSIAILTSERSELTDLRVLELADEIILAQRREIAEMQWLIDDIQDNGEVRTDAELEARPIPEFTFTNGRDEVSGDG
jgi:hypothetical protein